MRHAVSSVTIALSIVGTVVAPAGFALAAPAAAPVQAVPKKKCTVTDERLRELSGLVATSSGYVVINDSSDQESRKRVFYLDSRCEISKNPVPYSGDGPFDTEDLALAPDGRTLWIGDIGDNITSKTRRERIAVWTMPLNGSKRPVLHRLSYPEKKPHDAEALVVGDDNLPLIITRETSGKSEIFTPTAKLMSGGDAEAVPMKKVGEVTLPKTDTDNKLGAPGRLLVTGAARSPDGTKVVLRTYADAFEFDVKGGNVVAALTTGKPRITPLADPFGEAISYTPDGRSFVTVSDGGFLDAADPIDILGYTPSTAGVEALPNAGKGTSKPAATKSWLDGLTLDQITYLIAAVGVVGALMVGVGIVGIVRSRRKPAPGKGPDGGDEIPAGGGFPPPGTRPETAPGGVYGGAPARPAAGGVYGGAAQGGGVYGGGQRGGGRPRGGVYGGAAQGGGASTEGQRGGVYAGDQPGGGVYGGKRAEPPRRQPGYGDPRGRHGDGGYDDRGQYGPTSGGQEYRGDRY